MKKLLDTQKEGIKELMLKRAISKKWLEKCVSDTPYDIKNFDPEVGDKESEEYQQSKNAYGIYLNIVKQLETIDEANKGDMFAYSVLEECAKDVTNLLK